MKDPRNDLINHFTFKAFLFRGQRANEPLVVTAKIHACQEDVDCVPVSFCTMILNIKFDLTFCLILQTSCDSSRFKRSPVEITNSSAIIHDFDSQFAIRVVGLKDHSASITEDDFPYGKL